MRPFHAEIVEACENLLKSITGRLLQHQNTEVTKQRTCKLLIWKVLDSSRNSLMLSVLCCAHWALCLCCFIMLSSTSPLQWWTVQTCCPDPFKVYISLLSSTVWACSAILSTTCDALHRYQCTRHYYSWKYCSCFQSTWTSTDKVRHFYTSSRKYDFHTPSPI